MSCLIEGRAGVPVDNERSGPEQDECCDLRCLPGLHDAGALDRHGHRRAGHSGLQGARGRRGIALTSLPFMHLINSFLIYFLKY